MGPTVGPALATRAASSRSAVDHGDPALAGECPGGLEGLLLVEGLLGLLDQGHHVTLVSTALAATTPDIYHQSDLGRHRTRGRARHVGGSAERARVTVRKAIATAIDTITTVDPVVGRHVATHIRTGPPAATRPIRPAGDLGGF